MLVLTRCLALAGNINRGLKAIKLGMPEQAENLLQFPWAVTVWALLIKSFLHHSQFKLF